MTCIGQLELPGYRLDQIGYFYLIYSILVTYFIQTHTFNQRCHYLFVLNFIRMDTNPEQLQLNKILVDLEDEHKHLQVSINHLQTEIEKRELEVRKLLIDREIELSEGNSTSSKRIKTHFVDQQAAKPPLEVQFSSEFAKQVAHLLNEITKTAEEVSSLIKL